MNHKSRNSTPAVDDPAFEAGHKYVEFMVPKADSMSNGFPLWHGWALRQAFWAGSQWQQEQTAQAQEKT